MPDPAPPPIPQQPLGARRKAGFLQAIAAVFWSFFGIRRKGVGERDMVTIKPVYVVIAGLLGAAIFVGVLLALVTVVTRKG
ncbi:MAG: DUF2970 domain-containing protein [Betaproteobacteria bacterium]